MDIPAVIAQLDVDIAASPPASAPEVTGLAGRLSVTFDALRDFANEILAGVDDAGSALDDLVEAAHGDRPDAHTDLTGVLIQLRDTLIVPPNG